MKFKLLLIFLPFLPTLLPACQPENKGNSSTNDNQVVQSTDVAEFEDSQVYKIDIQFCGNRDQITSVVIIRFSSCLKQHL